MPDTFKNRQEAELWAIKLGYLEHQAQELAFFKLIGKIEKIRREHELLGNRKKAIAAHPWGGAADGGAADAGAADAGAAG